MEKKHKHLLIGTGVVIAAVGIAYVMYNKQTAAKAAAVSGSNNNNFIGKSPFVNSDGACKCTLFGCSNLPQYSQDNINNAITNLEKRGYSQLKANQMVQAAIDAGQDITTGQFAAPQPTTQTACCGFCVCNPQKGIEWYNPFSWSW